METVGIRITAADATRGAFDTVGANLKALQGSAAGVSAALAGIGAGITVGGFITLTKAAIDSLDALNDLKDATGASIENISALEDIARRTGTSFDTVGAALIKLNKALTTAKPGSDTEKAINAIGLSIKDLKTLDPAEAFQRIAVGLSKFADDGNKARLSQELFGKSLKEIAPLLNDVAERGQLVATVTTAQAAAAEAFNKQLFNVQKNAGDAARTLANELLPTLNEIAAEYNSANGAGTSFASFLGGVLRTALEVAALAISDVAFVLKGMGRELGAIAAQMVALATFDFKGFRAISAAVTEDAERARKELDAFQARLTGVGAPSTVSAYAKRQGIGEVLKQSVGDVLADTTGTKAATDANAALIASVQAGAAALKAEAESAEELSTVQKEIAKIYQEISTSKNKYNLQTLLTVDALLQEKLAYEKTIIARKDAATAQEERIRLGRAAAIADGQAVEAANAAYAAALDASKKLQEQYDAGFEQSAQRVADQVQALQDEARALDISAASNISLAQAVEQVSIARLNERLAIELSYGNDVTAAAIRKEIEARKELAGLIDSKTAREVAKDAAQDAANEWRKAADQIQTSITDALLRGFESGKDIAANLRDTIVNMFKTMVLRPVIQATVGGGLSAVGLTANAAGTGSSLLSGASLLNSAGSFGGLFASNAAYGAAIGTTSIGAGSQAAMLAAQTGEFGAAGLAATSSAAAGAGGGFSAALSAIPGWGWAALGVGALLGLMGGDKNKQQNTGNATSFFDASGTLTRQDTFFGGSSANADSVLAGLQSAYAKAAAALSIGTVSTAFNFGSNVRKDGTDPRFALGSYAGTSAFQQTETASSDAAISLAASRAVFAALQGSELPAYLAGVFNSLDVGGASQEQITGTLAYAQALKQVREALLETRTPLQILQDNLAAGTASLKTSAETFKGDFLAAIDAGITPEALAQWQALQSTMDQLATASGNADAAITAVTRSLADIANERARLQDQYDSLTLTSVQLVAKQRAGLDESNRALFDQVQALLDLKDAATATAEALATAAETLRTTNAARLDGATTAASDAFAGLQRAVAAQQAADNATYQAQRAAATAAYTSQQAVLQTSIDGARTSLDAVGDSVNRLKSFSSSLRSTLDGMRIAGSDAGNRASAQAEISAALARARAGGGLPLDGQLSSALATVAKPSEQLFASFADYAKDFYRTANDIAALAGLSDGQLNSAQAAQASLQTQIDLLEDQKRALKSGFEDQVDVLGDILTNAQRQVDAANGVNTSVLSVADAIKALDASIGNLSGVRASQSLATTPGVAEGRLTTIKAYMQSLADDKSLTDVQKANVLAAAARTNGVSEAEIAAAWGGSAAVTRQFFANAGIPQFAVGTNRVPRDMLAMLHKDEAIVPVAYNPAVGGNSNSETAAALRALADRLDRIEANTRATAGHTAGTDHKLNRVIRGNAIVTEAEA